MILGITGYICAGKGAVAKILRNDCGFFVLAFGDEVRKEATVRCIEHTRDNLQTLGNKLTAEHGEGYWSECIMRQMTPNRNYAIEGFRSPGQVSAFRRFEDFVLLGITAPDEVRFRRYAEKRARAGDVVTRDGFAIADARDRGEYDLSGQSSTACYQLKDCEITNASDNLESLRIVLTRLLLTIKS